MYIMAISRVPIESPVVLFSFWNETISILFYESNLSTNFEQ